MLAFATAPRYRDPWDCSEDKLPAVSLESLLLEIEASGRPAHRQATIRKALGLPVTDPGLERKLKDMEFWPADARSLDFDIADLLYMLPHPERATVYGLSLHVTVKELGKFLHVGPAMIYIYRKHATERLHLLANMFGAVGSDDAPIKTTDILHALGVGGTYDAGWIARNYRLPCPGLDRAKFKDAWPRLPRWEDLPLSYIWHLCGRVTPDTKRRYFPVHLLSEPQQPVAPGPEWVSEEQATCFLGARRGELANAVEKRHITPHLIPFYKGAWFKRADLEAYAASFFAAYRAGCEDTRAQASKTATDPKR